MQSESGKEPRFNRHGDTCAVRLLAASSPADVVATIAARLPVAMEAAFWSTAWPESIASLPADARDVDIARAVREVAAWQSEGRCDPRYVVICTGADGGTAVLRLAAPMPATATPEARLAATRMAEALALERLRGDVARFEKSERLQHALYAIADMAGSGLDMPDMLRGLHHIVSGLMYAENFYIALYDEASDSLRFAYFADTVDQHQYPADEVVPMSSLERGLTWYLVKDARPMMGSTEELRARMSGPLELHGADSSDWLGVPMIRDGRVRGALVVQSYLEGTRYTQGDMNLLAFVAEHALTAMERREARAQLEHRVEERTRQLAEANRDLSREVAERQRGERLQAALYRLAALASNEEGSDAFYRSVHQIVGGLINARNFYIALVSADGTEVTFPYAVDACETDWSPRSFGRGMTEYVMRAGKPQVVDTPRMLELVREGEVDPRFVDGTVTSWLGAPLLSSGGVSIGAVAVQSYSQSRGYDARDAELLAFAAHQIANSLQRRIAAEELRVANTRLEERVERRTRELREQVAQREQAEARLRHQVMHDPLTGLPNRVLLRERIDRAVAGMRDGARRPFALLYIDVDRFKQINDTLGHLVGDDVLREVAQRLSRIAPAPDLVARLSGDEFAILVEELDGAEDASRIATWVIEALRRPVLVGERAVQTSASIGIAVGDRGYVDTDSVLLDADLALYRAKERGRNRCVVFDDELQRAARDGLALERQIGEGLERDEFQPWFEPLVRLDDGEVIGHEALLRWHHPRRGVLLPGQFLQVAEDSGHLDAIDWRIFERACAAAASLPGDGFVSINLGARVLRDAELDARLAALVRAAGLKPGRLCAELGEDALLQDPDAVADVLHRLRDAGIDAMLDDFGTGRSSLPVLHRFPLRMIKIDRSVVALLDGDGDGGSESGNTDDSRGRGRAVLAAVIALARTLGLEALAVGVENEAQRKALLAMGCHYGQGFLFGRAHPAPASRSLR
jgi:diguanylate cyclase (GGDEF)-like protein